MIRSLTAELYFSCGVKESVLKCVRFCISMSGEETHLQAVATQDCLNNSILFGSCQEGKVLLCFAGIPRMRDIIHMEAVA